LRRPPLPIFNETWASNPVGTIAGSVSSPAADIQKGPVIVSFSKRRAGELKKLWPRSASHRVPDLTASRRIPCLCIAVLGLVSVSQLGCVAPSKGNAHASAGFTLDTPIEVIAADPGGAAVLNKDLPALLPNPNYSAFKAMNLKWLAAMSRGKLSPEKLAQIETDLQALPKQVAGEQ
jgi:hypothetical protein